MISTIYKIVNPLDGQVVYVGRTRRPYRYRQSEHNSWSSNHRLIRLSEKLKPLKLRLLFHVLEEVELHLGPEREDFWTAKLSEQYKLFNNTAKDKKRRIWLEWVDS